MTLVTSTAKYNDAEVASLFPSLNGGDDVTIAFSGGDRLFASAIFRGVSEPI